MINILRRFIQSSFSVINNSYFGFIFTKKIYQGQLKSFCAPGLNCYSCPAAIWACPIGSLQTIFASLRISLQNMKFHLGLYVIGFLGTLGMIAGRFPCGWLCPFGFLQELVYKIPSKKINIPDWTQYGKYFFLFFFVFFLPVIVVDNFGYGSTWFCKFICPAGTLEAGIPMIFLDPSLRRLIGILFYNKLFILLLFLIAMVFIRRPFCRTTCPLGGFYSFFNKISIVRMKHDNNKCVRCNQCFKDCPMHLKFYEGANQLNCIRCFKCYDTSCKYRAISIEIIGKESRQIKEHSI